MICGEYRIQEKVFNLFPITASGVAYHSRDGFGRPKYVCGRVKFSKYVRLVAQLGKQLPEKQILKIIRDILDKMVSILIHVIQHEQYFFLFRYTFLLSACSSQSHTRSCLSLMSHHRINSNCNTVKRTALKMANLCPT